MRPLLPTRAGLRIRNRLLVSFLVLALCLVLVPMILFERQARRSLEMEMGMRLEAVAAAASTQIDPSLVAAALSLPSESGQRTRLRLGERLTQLRDVTGVRRIYLLDRDGRDRLDTDPDAILGEELAQARAHRGMLEIAARGDPTSSPLFLDPHGEMRKTAYAPLNVKGDVLGFVGVEADARFLRDLGALRERVVLVGILGFLLSAILSFGLARGLTGPLNDLVEAARAMGSGNLEKPIPDLGADEVGFLAQTLEESRERLAERDKAQRAMVAGIAHEIRNPLGGIQIYVELLQSDPALSSAQKERVGKVLKEIHRLGEIVEEFLAYARPQVPVRESFDPRGIVGETVELLQGLAAEQQVRISVRPPSAATRVSADSGQIRQALLNLVRNAVEASPPGSEIRISWGKEGDSVAISVEDDGPGIPQTERARIFDPFFSTKSEGAGLGLPIVRRLCDQNGGRITLDEGPEKGCRFTIRLAAAVKGERLA